MRTKRQKCVFCGRYFIPDPRVGDRQKACFREECKRERQARSWKEWFKKNPDYFRGRYGYLKEWLREHPDYLKQYRKSSPEYVEKNREMSRKRKEEAREVEFDIQNEIKSQLIEIVEDKSQKAGFDIQNEIFTKVVYLAQVMLNLLPLIYKTR